MKKYLLSFGAVALALAPLATAISCGTKDQVTVSATTDETKKEMDNTEVKANLKKALNVLILSELQELSSVKDVIKSVMKGAEFQNVINNIAAVAYAGNTETITLTEANTLTDVPLVKVEITGITPATPTIGALVRLLTGPKNETLRGKLNELALSDLTDGVKVKAKIKAATGVEDYKLIIENNFSSATYDSNTSIETINFTDKTVGLVVTVNDVKGSTVPKSADAFSSAIGNNKKLVRDTVNAFNLTAKGDLTSLKLANALKVVFKNDLYDQLIDDIKSHSIENGTLTIKIDGSHTSKITGIIITKTIAQLKTAINNKADDIKKTINDKKLTSNSDLDNNTLKGIITSAVQNTLYANLIKNITHELAGGILTIKVNANAANDVVIKNIEIHKTFDQLKEAIKSIDNSKKIRDAVNTLKLTNDVDLKSKDLAGIITAALNDLTYAKAISSIKSHTISNSILTIQIDAGNSVTIDKIVVTKTAQQLNDAINTNKDAIRDAVNKVGTKKTADLTKGTLIIILKDAITSSEYLKAIKAIKDPSIANGVLTIKLNDTLSTTIDDITLTKTAAELKIAMEAQSADILKGINDATVAENKYTPGMFKGVVKKLVTDIAYKAGIDQITIAFTGATKKWTLTATLKPATTPPNSLAITVVINNITLT